MFRGLSNKRDNLTKICSMFVHGQKNLKKVLGGGAGCPSLTCVLNIRK